MAHISVLPGIYATTPNHYKKSQIYSNYCERLSKWRL